jgi:transcriptional regulator with XRE-family HTH domain
MAAKTISFESVRDELLKDPKIKDEYDKLKDEFDIARQIIALRKERGMNQRDFADMIGIKQPQLARLESGKQKPKIETLEKIARGTGYSIEIRLIRNDLESTKNQQVMKIIYPSI